jgi:hypothetical protein
LYYYRIPKMPQPGLPEEHAGRVRRFYIDV